MGNKQIVRRNKKTISVLLWEQEVAGSNPATPTIRSLTRKCRAFFMFKILEIKIKDSSDASDQLDRRKICHPEFISRSDLSKELLR